MVLLCESCNQNEWDGKCDSCSVRLCEGCLFDVYDKKGGYIGKYCESCEEDTTSEEENG